MSRPPVPLSQFVLKVHSRCDLACDHCYVYEAADQSWHRRPVVMSDQVVAETARRIAEHAGTHALPMVRVILHGGEPLLAGRSRLERIITTLRTAVDGVSGLDLRIHTNGVLLSEGFCELFADNGVKVGISLDGDRAANDRHRRYADGRSSYDKVIAAIGLLRTPRFRSLYAGLLCTIDTANDPLAVYDSLVALEPPRIDFLLPHATWDAPPARNAPGESEYADWLIEIYDRWAAQGRPVQIRTFDSVLSTVSGGKSITESLGLEPVDLAVIETDGSYEQVDSLKAAFDGAPETGTNVFDHDLDTVAGHPGIQARQQGIAGLCQTCRECPVVTSCGGGLYTHRYKTGSDFGNPSVYCADLLKLITHISSHQPSVIAGPPGIPPHKLAATDLEALAAGTARADVIMQLTDAQQSLMRAMLGSAYQTMSMDVAMTGALDLRAAWTLLTTLDRAQPKALGAVLRHPFARAWAMRCFKQLRRGFTWQAEQGRTGNARELTLDLYHLGAIAAAAAVRARMPATLTVPVVDGAVHLPSLGRLTLGVTAQGGQSAEGECQTAVVNVRDDAVVIEDGRTSRTLNLDELLAQESEGIAGNDVDGEWQPVRLLYAPGIRVALEDTDPYRACDQWPVAARLTDSEAARWQSLFHEAWLQIDHSHTAFASGLAAGLTALIPLSGSPGDRGTGTATRQAPGAVALALPDDPVTLALRIICAFQQVKLNAVLDLYDLYDPNDDRLFSTPWGEGKQRLEGLFQGAYAHLAGMQFWQARQQVSSGRPAEVAGWQFAQWQARSIEAIQTLAGSGSLTRLGTTFVERMWPLANGSIDLENALKRIYGSVTDE